MALSDQVEKEIEAAIKSYNGSMDITETNPFEELIGMGELIDRLSIVNFKLYTLKDEVMRRQDDKEFQAWAPVEDVKLVRERARLKACIDAKLVAVIKRINEGNPTGGINPEVKKYG